jgi:hypothetical protein
VLDMAQRDRTGWLRREDSNLCISESDWRRLSARGGRIRTYASQLKFVVPLLIPEESFRP